MVATVLYRVFPPGILRPASKIVLVALVYYAAARLGLVLAFEHTNASPVWPPSGIAMALVVILGFSIWPGILLGALFANYMVFAEAVPLPSLTLFMSSVSIAVGNTLEALSGAWLWRRLPRARRFALTGRGVVMFVAGACAVSLISSLVGSSTLLVSGLAADEMIHQVGFTWWLGDTTGILVFTPLILTWISAEYWRKESGWWLELALVVVASAFVAACVFSDWVFSDHFVSLPYLVLPSLLWAAYRFGVAGATVTVAVAAGIAITGTVDQHGVFGTGPVHSALLRLQVFVGVVAVTTLLLGAASEERLRYEKALMRVNRRLRERTSQLEYVNRELESFSYSVSHDLRAPLRAIDGFAAILSDEYKNRFDEKGKDYLRRVRGAAQRMGKLIDNMLQLARIGRTPLRKERVDVAATANRIITELRQANHHRECRFECDAGLSVRADPDSLRLVLQNLIGNAWKYTATRDQAWIHVGSRQEDGKTIYFVEDNGVGFDMRYADRLFVPFQRLHGAEFEGTGIGLATVSRIIGRHGGRCWATGEVGKGACFCFTLGTDGDGL